MLRYQNRTHGLPHESWVFCRLLVGTDKETILTHIIHNHVFKLYVAHVTLFVQDAKLLECAVSGDCSSLVTQFFTFSRVCQRVLLPLGHLFIASLTSRLGDVIVVKVGVQACVHLTLWLAINTMHLGHDALREDIVQLL